MPPETNAMSNKNSGLLWFPNHVDFERDKIELVKVKRAQLSQTTFLAGPDFVLDGIEKKMETLSQLSVNYDSPMSVAYIFHSAFCCSTLLARALDFPGKVRALKEPQVTLDIAEFIRSTGKTPAHTELIIKLLSDSGAEAETNIIKPTNMANNLLLNRLPILSKSPILLLYGSLRGFLISVLKKGEEGRYMVRRMYSIFTQDPTRFKQIPLQQLATLTDLQIAAMTWLLQTEIFENYLTNYLDNRVVSLHCDQFLAQPATCLSAINRHFSLNLSDSELAEIYESDTLKRNSKQQKTDYNANTREFESANIEKEYGATLDRICQWADGVSVTGKVRHELSRPLLADKLC